MARVRQFAKDMGLSYNKAKSLVNKGRKLKDGGSSVSESTMNKVKPIKANQGKFKNPGKAMTSQFKNIQNLAATGKLDRKKALRMIRELVKKNPMKKMKEGGATEFGMLSVKAGIDNNPEPTQADRIAGATKGKKMMRGGPVRNKQAMRRRAMPKPARFERNLNQPKELVTPFKGILKTSEGEKLKNIDGKTYLVKPNPAYKPKPPAYKPKSPKLAMRGKKMRGGGLAIQGTQFRGVR